MMRHMAVADDQQLAEPAVRSFIERFALVLAAAGMQRMAARAFAALLVSEDGSLTAREFAELLQVSPADQGSARITGRWVGSPGTRLSAPAQTSSTG